MNFSDRLITAIADCNNLLETSVSAMETDQHEKREPNMSGEIQLAADRREASCNRVHAALTATGSRICVSIVTR